MGMDGGMGNFVFLSFPLISFHSAWRWVGSEGSDGVLQGCFWGDYGGFSWGLG